MILVARLTFSDRLSPTGFFCLLPLATTETAARGAPKSQVGAPPKPMSVHLATEESSVVPTY
jgi:hypothetical protein